ncbi:hypothetical protein K8R43_05450 [archaeon]|nr:hypothetical protein [archaeon]
MNLKITSVKLVLGMVDKAKNSKYELMELNEMIHSELLGGIDKKRVNAALCELTLVQKKSPRFSHEIIEHIINKDLDDILKKSGHYDKAVELGLEKLVFSTTRKSVKAHVGRYLNQLIGQGIVKRADWYKHRKMEELPPYGGKHVYFPTRERLSQSRIKK